MPDHLSVERLSAHLTQVTLQRPQVRNAFNPELVAELTGTFLKIADDPELRGVIMAAEGPAFCAGADLNWMQDMAHFTWEQNQADALALARMLHTIYTCPVPLVGRIQGDCYGGGVGLAAVCDVLVAAEGVQFCLSEARLGLVPATISPYVILAMGLPAARRYFLTAERFSAAQAQAMGWVAEVCTLETLDAGVNKIIEAILANGPQSTRACKRLIQTVMGRPLGETLITETAALIADIRCSPEGQEGIQSFLQKRRPHWVEGGSCKT
ncbi:MAG: enoyl-CoA hydratase/isomerase family protein [Burkholderiales bacterium]